MDAMHFGGPTRDVTVVNIGASELEDYLAAAAKAQGRVLEAEPTPEKGTFFRSDHFNFAKRGVPALYIKGGVDDRENGREWRQKYLADFTAQKYHKVGDEYSPDADLRAGVAGHGVAVSPWARSWPRKNPGPTGTPTANFVPRATGAVRRMNGLPEISGGRAGSSRRRARTCRWWRCKDRSPGAPLVGKRKSPNKVTFMSCACFGSWPFVHCTLAVVRTRPARSLARTSARKYSLMDLRLESSVQLIPNPVSLNCVTHSESGLPAGRDEIVNQFTFWWRTFYL